MISNPVTVQRAVVLTPDRDAGPALPGQARRSVIAAAVVLAHALGLYVAVHQSTVSMRLEDSGSGVRSVQARLVAAPASPAPTPHELQPETQPVPKPQPQKPVPEKPKVARVLSTEAPAARAVAAAYAQQPKPDPAAQPIPAPAVTTTPPAAQPATQATQPAAQVPDQLASPKQISAGELQQLGCQIPSPEYPAKARRLQQEGTVVVGLTIDPAGAVSAAQVVRSSGSPMLDAAAVAAIRGGRCHPYRTAGIPRAVQATQPIAFNLND
ncbi:protein TonB [Paraburkholderia sp. GAS333]|uniref:energy transducer TonB n=1 Tax=Paraburkholderia sp. GAS333 TaxID=3156279 RepID=UPI003D2137D7